MDALTGQLLRLVPLQVHTVTVWEDAMTGRPVRMELRESTLPPAEQWPPGFPDALKDAQRRARAAHDTKAQQNGGPTAEQVARMTREYLAAERFGASVGGTWTPFTGPIL